MIKRESKVGVCNLCTKPTMRNRVLCKSHILRKRIRERKYTQKVKAECLSHYGSTCNCCGENLMDFLSIDHVNGGGNTHRREVFGTHTMGGLKMYAWLKRNNYPDGFQVLCMNCNFAKGHFGQCPHIRNEQI